MDLAEPQHINSRMQALSLVTRAPVPAPALLPLMISINSEITDVFVTNFATSFS